MSEEFVKDKLADISQRKENFNQQQQELITWMAQEIVKSQNCLQQFEEPLKPFLDHIYTLQKMLSPALEAVVDFTNSFGPFLMEMVKSGKRLYRAISILGEHQYVYWAPLGEDLINEILTTDNVDEVLYRYEKKNRYKFEKVVRECRKNHYLFKHRRMFKQAINAYNRGDYDISAIALLSVLDGLLKSVGADLDAQMKQNKDAFLKKIGDDIEETSEEYLLFSLKMTLSLAINEMVRTMSFKKEEPIKINRHWIMHGRSTRNIKALDCIKIIYCIYGIIILGKISSNNSE